MPEPAARDLATVAELRVALRRYTAATDEVTSAHGLTPRQYDLLALLHAPDAAALTATAVAERLALSRSATTELLTRAAQAGLVTREPGTLDLRVKPLAATPEGTRRFLGAVADLRAERARLLSLLRTAAVLAAMLPAAF